MGAAICMKLSCLHMCARVRVCVHACAHVHVCGTPPKHPDRVPPHSPTESHPHPPTPIPQGGGPLKSVKSQ